VTGYHQDLEKYPSEQLPLCGGFLLKPFTPQVLARAIRKTLAAVADRQKAAATVGGGTGDFQTS
jgi:hypothetical protein